MKKKLNIKPTISHLEVPFMKQQDKLEVEVVTWQGDKETRYSVILRTINSYVSISLSRKQMLLLKEQMMKFI